MAERPGWGGNRSAPVKRIYQAVSLICAGIGVFFMFQGYRLRIEGQLGPGPGFFPFWIGAALTTLSAVWLVQASIQAPSAKPPDLLPPRSQRVSLVMVVVALAAFMLLLRPIGFDLTMLALLLFLFFLIDRKFPVAKVIIALLGSFGVHRVFEQLLRVPLPYASLQFLRQFGL